MDQLFYGHDNCDVKDFARSYCLKLIFGAFTKVIRTSRGTQTSIPLGAMRSSSKCRVVSQTMPFLVFKSTLPDQTIQHLYCGNTRV